MNDSHWIALLVVGFYVVGLFAATAWARRVSEQRSSGLVGYLLAGRDLPAPIAAALLAGLAVGGASTIGVAERAYSVGISAGWYNAAWAVGAFVMGSFTAARYRSLEVATLPELFERHYSVSGRVIGVVGQLVIQIVITSLQYVAGGAILSSLLPGVFTPTTGMLVTAVVFVSIALIGGFWAAGITNVVNVTVIYLGILLGVGLTLGELGGIGELTAKLPAEHPGFDWLAIGPGIIVAWMLVMITTVHSTQSVIQVGFAARDPRHASRAYLWGGLLILPVGFLSALLGMAAAVQYPDIVATEALPRVVLGLPALAAGIILAGLWAADVSTASALLMGSATLVCGDVVRRFFVSDLDPSQEKRLGRWVIAGLSVVTLLLALQVRGILQMLLVGLTLSTAYTLLVLMTLYFPRLCRRSSATWTLSTTMIALVVWQVAPAAWRFLPHPIYFTWIVSLLTFLVVSVVDRRPIRD